jgi:glycerol kinase
MGSSHIAALDIGTTSTRCMIFDRGGMVVSAAQKEHGQIYPKPGWVEHDPRELVANAVEVIHAALVRAHLGPSDLAGLGVANQRETTVIWDRRSGKPIYNAIVWQDTRTDRICAELGAEGGPDRLRESTGLPLSTYFAGPKARWLLENVPDAAGQAAAGELCFGTVDTWCIWNLTGGPEGGAHVTDVSNASRTQLMNLRTLEWDETLLGLFGLPRSMLPTIRPSSGVFGEARLGGDVVPIAAVLGDQQAALFGQSCFEAGNAKNTYGTGCFLLLNTGASPVMSHAGLLTTLAYQLDGAPPVYALEGSIAVAGALVQWLRDNLGIIHTSEEIEALAYTVADNGGVYFVPAFSGLFAPYWRADARGVIAGLTRYVTRGHLARAVLEATAWQTREVADAMREDCGLKLTELRVDGGMVRDDLLMQIQADALGVPVIRPQVAETTALGAAFAAGLATGFWPDLESVRSLWREDRRWTPGLDEETRERSFALWKKAVTRTLGWLEPA